MQIGLSSLFLGNTGSVGYVGLHFGCYLSAAKSMYQEDSCSKLLKEVQSKIAALQKVVSEVGLVKASLQRTASDVKTHIRDSISRHLEALRNRETWLLGQVEVVQHIKEDVLRQQQGELNKAVGRLQTACSLLQQNGDIIDVESLKCQLTESFTATENLNLAPEETNVISFVAKNFEFQEAVRKFGIVISDNPTLDRQMALSFQGLGFSSGKQVEAASSEKRFDFFTPSGPCEEWLLKPKGESNSSQDAPRVSPADSGGIREWPGTLSSKSLSSSVQFPLSIECWLSRSQTENMTPGTDDSELEIPVGMDSASDNDVAVVEDHSIEKQEEQDWLLKSTGKVTHAVKDSNLFNYYQVVKMSDSSTWLRKSQKTKEELSTDLIGKTFGQIATSHNDEWLMKKKPTASQSRVARTNSTLSCSDCSCEQSFACLDCEWQENSLEFDDASSAISNWLAVKKDNFEKMTPSTTGSEVLDNDKWLLKSPSEQKDSTEDCSGIKHYKEKLDSEPNNLWLYVEGKDVQHTGTTESSERPTSGIKSYIESLPVDYNHWLSRPVIKSDICKWLARSSLERCKNCPSTCSKGLFNIFGEVANSDKGWLLSSELY